jgi:hypothetical protein
MMQSFSGSSFNDYLGKAGALSSRSMDRDRTGNSSRLSGGRKFSEHIRSRFLETDSDMSDTWAEIADASLVVERAMDRLDTLKSEDTEDPEKLKYLLSVVSDEDTIGDVEKALTILKKHAARLGVKETDLLLAVESHDTNSVDLLSANASYKSLTFGEELYNIFNVFMKKK